jgi:hypothetical protein
MNANQVLFRSSSAGHLMTEPQTKAAKEAGELSETTKTHLVDVYVREAYNRFTEINGKALDKGNEVEEDSITVVSRITKEFYVKNEIHLSNAYIKGTPDLFKGESIYMADLIRDTKSSWDLFTFNRAIRKELNKLYYWQMQCYMALTGAKKAYVDYCLNNTPYHLVEGELRKESYNHLNNDTPAWIELQIIANHTYDKATFEAYIQRRGIDIHADENAAAIFLGFVEVPLKERHYAFEVERNDEDIKRLYRRIEDCRAYLNENFFKQTTEAA